MQPRERLMVEGITTLSEAELVALILKSGTHGANVISLAKKVLFYINKQPTIAELEQIHGIGRAKACQIMALIEFAKRFRKKKIQLQQINDAKSVYELFRDQFVDAFREEMIVVFLNAQLQIISFETVFSGTLDAMTVHPREIYYRAIKHVAHSIIIMHNHPSGDANPSNADLEITKRVATVGDIIGIPLLDHIIVTEFTFWSWAKANKA